MVAITSPFLSLEGQKQRLQNVANTFSAIGSNLLSGKLLTGVPVAEKYEGTVVGKVASAVTTPAFVVAAPAAVATAVVAGPTIAAGVSAAAKATNTAVKNVVAKVTGSQTLKTTASSVVVQKLTQTKPQVSINPAAVAVQTAPTGPTGSSTPQIATPSLPVLTGADNVASAPAVNSVATDNSLMSAPIQAMTSSFGSVVSQVSTVPGVKKTTKLKLKVHVTHKNAAKKAKSHASRPKTKKKTKGGASHRRMKGTSYGSKSKKIHYTRNGQPYIKMASGKARFIKKSSAHNRKMRKGGYY